MKISICIPTHNRPRLFNRAIESVLSLKTDHDLEIWVNNDSNDITELYSDSAQIYYSYYQNDDLSQIYKKLLNNASGDYVYFLEDDDYLNNNFFDKLDLNYDINYMLYTSIPHINEVGVKGMLERQHINDHLLDVTCHNKFIDMYDDTYFQLGQIIFRKDKVVNFPEGNCLNNDYIFFNCCFHVNTTIKYINKQLWTQTIDGNDNISFDRLNNDDRFY